MNFTAEIIVGLKGQRSSEGLCHLVLTHGGVWPYMRFLFPGSSPGQAWPALYPQIFISIDINGLRILGNNAMLVSLYIKTSTYVLASF